jgi:RNA polymerase sigma factor (sigma-70 family)
VRAPRDGKISGTPAREIDTPAREIDALTLGRAQRGDDDARHALVVTYQRPVFALLARMLGPGRGALVEDLAQDTFLHVFRSLERFAPLGQARLSTWILTRASRRAMDELRRQGPVAGPLAGEDGAGPSSDLDRPASRTNIEQRDSDSSDELAMGAAAEPPEGFAERVVAARHRAVKDVAGAPGSDPGNGQWNGSGPPRSWWGRFGTSRPALIASAAVVVACMGVLIAALRHGATVPAGSGYARPEARATNAPPAPRPGQTGLDPCAPGAPRAPAPGAFAIDPAPPRDISRDELLARDQFQREQIARLRAELSTVQRDLQRMVVSGCPDRDEGQE